MSNGYGVPSVWAATAPEVPVTPPLTETVTADVAVIGAGITGLTAALRLACAGTSVVVVDRQGPGYGASGRNGGQVIPGLKYDPPMLDKLYGPETTAFVGATADVVFDLVARHGLECEAARDGWIQATVKQAHLPALQARMQAWQQRGAPVEMLDAAGMKAKIGSEGFVGGWLDGRAGRLHPLKYSYELARAVLQAGGRIHGQTAVVSMERHGALWHLKTASGAEVRAAQVVIATNGYTDSLWPQLKATVIPATSFQVATVPLSDKQRQSILPRQVVVSDSRRIGNYFRIAPNGGLMLGGRGTFREPQGMGDYRRILAALEHFFPEVAGMPIAHAWSGRVAMTYDHLPHLHHPVPTVTMALGYNGRGVALGSAFGTAIADSLLDPTQPLPLPFTAINPLYLHDLHPVYASMAIWYYRMRDYLER